MSAKPSSKRRERKSQGERRLESMTLILDCAEARFAEHGFNGVTLNDVAAEAGVDASLMRYYFGDKKQLFKAVFGRRGPVINEMRLKAMADYRAKAGERATLAGLVDAFTRPAFEMMAKEQGWRNYMAIVAYVNSSRGFLHELMSETFDHVSHELIQDFRRLHPQVPEQEYYWAYQFLTGTFTFSLGQTGRVDALSKGLVKSSDMRSIADRLPIAIAAGIEALFVRARVPGRDAAARRAKRPPRAK